MTRTPKRVETPLEPEQDVDREIAFHIDETRRVLIADGWSPDDARREAQRRFGDTKGVRGDCVRIVREHQQSRRRAQMFRDFMYDLRFSLRMLRRQPRTAILAVLTMALGIGAVSALFTVVNQVVLAPLPYPGSESIVDLAEGSETGRPMRVSAPNFADWRAEATAFEGIAAYSGSGAYLVRGLESPLRARVVGVSESFFQVFKTKPLVGRLIDRAEPLENGAVPVVVSEAFWRRHLDAGEMAVLGGYSLEIRGQVATIVGVVPDGFRVPEDIDLWLGYEPDPEGSGRDAHNWRVVARLAPQVDLAAAQAEMNVIAGRLAELHPSDNDAVSVLVRPLRQVMVGAIRNPLFLLMGAAGLLLLLACANLTSSLIARANARQRELAIRTALGAGRLRILRQLLAETVLLHVLGALAGVGAAFVAVRTLVALRPADLVRLDEVGVDGTALAFGLAVAIATGLVFGLAPARTASRSVGALGRSRADHGRHRRGFDLLIASEAALALVLLAGAAFMLRNFVALTDVDFGYGTENVLTAELLPPIETELIFEQGEAIDRAEDRLGRTLAEVLESVAMVPGIADVGLISRPPLGGGPNGSMCVDNPERLVDGQYRVVGGDYFGAMVIPVVAGRVFDDRDRWGGAPTVVVSARFAADAWPGDKAVGKQLCTYGMDRHGDVMATVIGVVGDVRHRGPTDPPSATVYVPMLQRALRAPTPTLVARTLETPTSLDGPVRAAIAAAVPGVPVSVSNLRAQLSAHLAPRRFALLLIATFAVVALILAATGVYGVVAFSVSRRRREIGIRMALGAAPRSVVRSMMGHTLIVVGAGLIVGLGLTLALSRFLDSAIEGLHAADAATLSIAIGVLTLVAATACWIPARRAARIDPTATLRGD